MPGRPRMTRAQINSIRQQRELRIRIEQLDDQYVRGSFGIFRLYVHYIGATLYIFTLYFYYYMTNMQPTEYRSNRMVYTRFEPIEDDRVYWTSNFKYFSFFNAMIQLFYHMIGLSNECIGTNQAFPAPPVPKVRLLRDYIFAVFALPSSINCFLSFWILYYIDRELVYPVALQNLIPTWFMFVAHSNSIIFSAADIISTFREYPHKEFTGIKMNFLCALLFMILVSLYYLIYDVWPFECFAKLKITDIMAIGTVFPLFCVVCYILGEVCNNIWWGHRIRLIRDYRML